MNVLFLLHPGGNSRSIFWDLVRGFERAGHRAIVYELGPLWQAWEKRADLKPPLLSLASATVKSLVESNRVGLTVGMWANGLMSTMSGAGPEGPRSVFDLIGVPHLLFWLDAPQWAHGGTLRGQLPSPLMRGPMLHHLINNGATAREMREVLGFQSVHAMPYGIDERVFCPYDEPAEFDVVFGCGPGDPPPTAAALEELGSSSPDFERVRREAAGAVLPRLDALAASAPASEPERVRELFRRLVRWQVSTRRTPMLERLEYIAGEDETLAGAARALRTHPRLFIEATMLVRSVEAAERCFTISLLSRHLRCAVFGGADLGAWGFRGRDFGQIAYEDQAKAYSRGRIGLNAMRWQDDAGLNLKPFEITASGAACLCVRRDCLEECFHDGTELVTYATPGEALERARELLESPSRLASIAQAGRERTLRDHTWRARALRIVEEIGAA